MAEQPHQHPEESDPEMRNESEHDEIATLRSELEAAQAERERNFELAARAQAELENLRRRVNREREEDARFRSMSLARDLLPVIDNLHRAVAAGQSRGNLEELLSGLNMVLKQLDDTLSKHFVVPIRTVGELFDPNRHEALTQVPSAEHEPMTVLQEVERGYTMHDRVLRPGKVIVAAPRPDDN